MIYRDGVRGVKGLHCALNSKYSGDTVAYIYLISENGLKNHLLGKQIEIIWSLIRIDHPVVKITRITNGEHPTEPTKITPEGRLRDFRITTPRCCPDRKIIEGLDRLLADVLKGGENGNQDQH